MKKLKIMSTLLSLSLLTTTVSAMSFENVNNVKSNKAWNVKFNKNIDKEKFNDKAIKIVSNSGQEHEVKFEFKDKEVKVIPISQYKNGETYKLIVNEDVFIDKKLKEDADITFTVEENKIKDNDTNEDYTKNIEDLAEVFSIDRAEIKEDGIYYTYFDAVDYLPQSKVNPKMNEQIYNLVKYLIYDDNEKKNFVRVSYLDDRELCGVSDVSVDLLEYWNFPNEKFSIVFEESELNQFNNFSKIWIELRPLSDKEYKAKKKEIGVKKAFNYAPNIVNKFKNSIKIIFSDKDWESIYDFIMEQYDMYASSNEEFSNSKEIDGIKVISKYDRFGHFYIYFQY